MIKLQKWRKPAVAIVALVIVFQAGGSLLARTHRVHAYLVTQLERAFGRPVEVARDRKSTRLNSSHPVMSYAVFCLKKKNGTCSTRCRVLRTCGPSTVSVSGLNLPGRGRVRSTRCQSVTRSLIYSLLETPY